MATPSADDFIDRVDARDRPVGVVRRGAALAEGANFRTSHVFVFDQAGRLLLQQLAPTRERHPGRWGSSVAAYLFAGETYWAAARRRMISELGLRGRPRLVGKIRMRDEDSTKFVELFEFVSNHAEICAPSHIAALKFWTAPELSHTTRERPDLFTPTFLQLYSFYGDGQARKVA